MRQPRYVATLYCITGWLHLLLPTHSLTHSLSHSLHSCSIPHKHLHVQRALECLQVIIKQSPLALCKKVGTGKSLYLFPSYLLSLSHSYVLTHSLIHSDNNYAMLRALLLALEKCVGEQSIIDSCIYTLLCLLSGVGITGITTINKCEWRVLNRNITGHNRYDSR